MSENEMKLLGRETIEAYISEGGFICLKQDSAMGEDPSVVMMLPHDIPTVVGWLQNLAGSFRCPKMHNPAFQGTLRHKAAQRP